MNDDVLNGSQQNQSTNDDINLLVLALDLNLHAWGRRSIEKKQSAAAHASNKTLITLSQFVNQLLLFINAYLMCDSRNKIAIVASSFQHSDFVFPTKNEPASNDLNGDHSSRKASDAQHDVLLIMRGSDKDTEDFFLRDISFSQVKSALLNYLRDLNERSSKIEAQANPETKLLSTSLSGALSKALCYINRMQKEKPQGNLQSRMLIFQLCSDIPTQYISVMNAIFSAQKMNVVLDSVVLNTEADSSFLQQASFITEGVYMRPVRQEGLLQYLMSVYMVSISMRKHLINLPVQSSVDFRASCFETKQSIDQGFVCSVCLSVFSKLIPVCSTCGEKLAPPALSGAGAAPRLLAPPIKK